MAKHPLLPMYSNLLACHHALLQIVPCSLHVCLCNVSLGPIRFNRIDIFAAASSGQMAFQSANAINFAQISMQSMVPSINHQDLACGCSEPSRVAIGPAAPPPELLAAAAQLPWEEDEEDVEDLIGPAPPEMAEELDGVGGDERVAEVARVIR